MILDISTFVALFNTTFRHNKIKRERKSEVISLAEKKKNALVLVLVHAHGRMANPRPRGSTPDRALSILLKSEILQLYGERERRE